ncbi:hypothetical protein Dimus_034201 [Dionaea muscipula]
MAFHVACPITCKRICSCALGFRGKLRSEQGRSQFLDEIAGLEKFLEDPWLIRVRDKVTVHVPVPRVLPSPTVVVTKDAVVGGVGGGGGGDVAGNEELSAQTKRALLQKRAAVASLANEDFARRFESGALVDAQEDLAGEEQGQSNVNIMCRICFSGENEGSQRAKRMISCRSCSKKYHRSCLKVWSQHRDLFHWSSWTCPSCRVCEVCRRTGDPNKFKFCRRCDGAYHCYCMQPPHKNVSSGPYLCPKHTRCHSCGSNVPGNGLSVRWFLGYTCCDACGRLFTKGNYCPVCLKVYRDSESTPMVCCDICQRWVHCQCDSISDEKYLQFQVDGNLPYTCPTCRGECYQVRDLEDAVQELWRRKDEAERDIIANLRASAGLPTQEEIFSISPFSDDEDNSALVKNEYGRMKLSFKGMGDNSPKKSKELSKKSSSKKQVKKKDRSAILGGKTEIIPNMGGYQDTQSFQPELGDEKDDIKLHKSIPTIFPTPAAESLSPAEGMCSINQQGVLKHIFVDEVAGNSEQMRTGVIQIKNKKFGTISTGQDVAKDTSKPKPVKGTKLVIHLGVRNKTITNSPLSDSSNHHQEQGLVTFGGSEAMSQRKARDKNPLDGLDGAAIFEDGHKDDSTQHKERVGNFIKLGKRRPELSDLSSKSGRGNGVGENGLLTPGSTHPLSGNRGDEAGISSTGYESDLPKGGKASVRKYPENISGLSIGNNKKKSQEPGSQAVLKDSKPLLKVKIKSTYEGSWGTNGEEEKGSVKGQRSKRKRPSLYGEKLKYQEDEVVTDSPPENLMHEVMDAGILRRLGKDAIGKRVEVHQQYDDSWHKGVVSEVSKGSSMLSVDLDDGRSKTIELGKQGIRFVLDKQKRRKT